MILTPRLKRVLISFLMVVGSILIGVAGYTSISGYSLGDAFYMSMITLSTVGFGEVLPLDTAGRIFTAFYILLNIGIFAYAISALSSFLLEGELNKILKNYQSEKEMSKLKDHVIVCGYGRNGKKAAEELSVSGKTFVVIEKDPNMGEELSKLEEGAFIIGDATLDAVLEKAGIDRAECIISTLPNDSENVFITLTAKELNPKVLIISRANEENSEKKLYRAGAHHVVMPDTLGGLHMARLLTKPYVIEFLDLLSGAGKEKLMLEEIPYADLKAEFKDQSIRDLDIRRFTGATIIAVKDNVEGFIFNPNSTLNIRDNNVLILLGTEREIHRFREHYCG